MKLKKLISGLTSLALSLTAALSLPGVEKAVKTSAEAANEYVKFDFGAGGVEPGYVGVSASEGYSSQKGYGFNTPASMADTSAAGSGALYDLLRLGQAFWYRGLSGTEPHHQSSGLRFYGVHILGA